MLAYSWAWDKFLQAIKRIYRLTSPEEVNVYSIICDGSVDRKLEGNIHEKGDAAGLVLDGHLLGEDPTEINLAELLKIAHEDFAKMSAASGIDERELVKEWPGVRMQLSRAMRAWSRPIPEPATKIEILPSIGNQKSQIENPVDPLFADLPLWKQAA